LELLYVKTIRRKKKRKKERKKERKKGRKTKLVGRLKI